VTRITTTVSPQRSSLQGPIILLLATAICLIPAALRAAYLGPASTPRGAAELVESPPVWPNILALGVQDGLGGAAFLNDRAPFGFRYQYLAGGVNTGSGWATWNPDGTFVPNYVQESLDYGLIPVFTYYMLTQSRPGSGQGEPRAAATNLQDADTMGAYYDDLRLFFQRAATFPDNLIVLHVEPDLWGFAEQRARGDQAANVPVQVAATGRPELAGLPDDLRGFAQAIIRLRDRYASNVLLWYHVSPWGTGDDLIHSRPPAVMVDGLADRAARYYASLEADFDLIFAEFSDRDAGYKQYVDGDRGAWWRPDDFNRHTQFLGRFARATQKRIVLWQIPFGNTKMRAMNNTRDHYQDNRVEWLLDDPSGRRLQDYAQAGVIALLFGRGAAGTTCPCDAAGDGVTDPEPINGNDRWSLSADDDGGFFMEKARAYYAAGPLELPSAAAQPH